MRLCLCLLFDCGCVYSTDVGGSTSLSYSPRGSSVSDVDREQEHLETLYASQVSPKRAHTKNNGTKLT